MLVVPLFACSACLLLLLLLLLLLPGLLPLCLHH